MADPPNEHDQPQPQPENDATLDFSDSAKPAPEESDRTAPTKPKLDALGETANLSPAADSRSADVADDQVDVPVNFGAYAVQRVLGKGGFGAVYLAYDQRLDRHVAIKTPLGLQENRHVQKSFLREARKLAHLHHSGIVTVLDVAVEEGRCYIVSEYLDGPDLDRWLKERQVPWQQAVEIVAQVADALAHAHSQSVVHRDLKPGNIILIERAEGLQPVVVDFGLALDEEETRSQYGEVAGTPNYMSPEQALGKGHRIDGRTDIYALGVILYRMLCGQLPFKGRNTSDLLRQLVSNDPKPPRQIVREIPAALEAACLKAMAKQVGDRFTTAGDMAAELRKILADARSSSATQGASAEGATHGPARRQVTVVNCNCDLFETGEFCELDPEQQHELLTEYQQMCKRVVATFDGRIVQSTGQTLLACFGYPTAHEDAAARAVHAALRLIEEIGQLQQRLRQQEQLEFACSACVHTGFAVVQEAEGGESLSMMGDVRNIAARLESVAEEDAVTITAATHRIVKGFFECESRGRFKVKGAPQKLEVYLVTGASAARDRVEVAESFTLTPLVGRDTEMAIIMDIWEQAAEGMGQIVCLLGEAGLGKSRLVKEVREQVAAGEEPHAIIEWRCSPFFRNTGFHPAIDYFERILNFQQELSPARRLDAIVEHLEDRGLGDPQSIALTAALLSAPTNGRVPDLELSPVRQRQKTQELLLRWVQAGARQQPALFIIEDLHWVDASTLEWLGQLVNQVGQDCSMTLLTFRPEFETPWGSRGYQTQVALNRFSTQQIEEMVRRRLDVPDVPRSALTKLIERTEGVPLFIEEFCNVMLETGAVEQTGEGPRVAEDFKLDTIPSTLQDLLISRLERLGSRHDIAQVGAAIGREFSYEILRAVTGVDDPELEHELGKLVASEVIFPEGTPPQAVYTFKHALIQDAAYDSLLRKTRQQYHSQIADALEQFSPETVDAEPELLAHHRTQAGQTQQAIDYWQRAGKKSQAMFANEEAINHYRAGLELAATLDPSPERDQLELGFQVPLSTVLTMARGWASPDVEPVHVRARELCQQLGPAAPLFHVTWGMWAWRLLRDELDVAAELARDVWRLAEQQQDDGYLMEACFSINCTALFRGELETCVEYGERGIALYDEQRCRFHASITTQNAGCTIRAMWGWAAWMLGYPDRAREIGAAGVSLGEDLNDPFSHAFALYHLGCVQQHCRMGRHAFKSGERALAIGTEQGFAIWVALGTLCMGSGLVLEGKQIDEGVELVKSGFDSFRASGAELSLSHYYAVLAEAYQAAGKIDEALEAVQGGLDLAQRTNERFHDSNLHRLRGELTLAKWTEREDEAAADFEQALAIARQQQARSWELRAAMSLGQVWRNNGRADDARQLLSDVYSQFSEGFGTADLQQAKAILDGG